MSLVLFAENIIEDAASVTVTNALATNPKENLYDRDRGEQTIATGAGQWDITIDRGSGNAQPASALALVNHNIGANVEVYGDTVTPPAALIATFSPAGIDPFYGTFTSPGSRRYWRIRMLAYASAVAIGESLLGIPQTIGLNPSLFAAKPHTLRNVQRIMSKGGFAWALKRGDKRTRLAYAWEALGDADVAILEAASDELSDGAKNLLVIDPDGVRRWMFWATLNIEPGAVGGGHNRVEAVFEQAL